jgi:hypothetical protein
MLLLALRLITSTPVALLLVLLLVPLLLVLLLVVLIAKVLDELELQPCTAASMLLLLVQCCVNYHSVSLDLYILLK